MEIRTLRYFLEIAKHENMTIAAKNLHVSQSALSRQMSDLEKELGKSLFTRTNRQTLLTEDGIHLRLRAEEIISLVDKTEKEMMNDNQDITGELHIGAGETKGFHLISQAIRNTQKKYPHITFSIYSGNANDISEKLEHGLLDFGLMFEPVNKERYQYVDFPYINKLGLLVKKDHPLATRNTISLNGIKDIPLLMSSRLDHHNLLSSLSKKEIKLDIKATYNLIYNASLMVEEDIGCALTIDGLIHNDQLRFIPFYPDINLKMVFVWKKNHLHSKAFEVFLNELNNIIKR